jgi:carbamoyltransferase
MKIIGFNLSHDSSVCLVEDGRILIAAALERTSRIKRGIVPEYVYAAAMAGLVREALSAFGLSAADVDYWIATSTESRGPADEARLGDALGLLAPADRILALPHPGHHLAHAAAAFHTSGFDRAAAVVIDAYGSLVGEEQRERESGFAFRLGLPPERVLGTLRDRADIGGILQDGLVSLPCELSGIGELYRVITLALGFYEGGSLYDDAGKTMGLAPYGKRLSGQAMFIRTGPGGIAFDGAADSLIELGLASRSGDRLVLRPRQENAPIEQFHRDLAAQIQSEFEDACLHVIRAVLDTVKDRSLVLSGGCFLNSVLNTRVARETGVDNLFVFPAATDDGNSVGAALYAYHHLIPGRPPAGQPAGPQIAHVFSGIPRVSGSGILRLARAWGLEARDHSSDNVAADAAAQAVASGQIIGWFQDRAEFGPRALGARSVLCHPGVAGMKDRLNARVKFREPFRPFAASVLLEHAADWFDMPVPASPFMLFVCPVRPDCRAAISEVVHVDGTCRVQTVASGLPGPFRVLLEAFHAAAGLPMVLNTSLNLRGMPLAERPEEALDCLYGSRLDRMFIGTVEILAPDFAQLCPQRSHRADHRRADADQLPAPMGSVLDLADGGTSLQDMASALDLGIRQVVDAALGLRRKQQLSWAKVPVPHRPAYPLRQYTAVRAD